MFSDFLSVLGVFLLKMKSKIKFLNFRYLPFMLFVAIVGILLISLLDFAYTIAVFIIFLFSMALAFFVKKWRKYTFRMFVLFVTFVIFVFFGGQCISNAKQFRMPINDAIITGTINSDSDINGVEIVGTDKMLYTLVLTDCSYYKDDEHVNLDGMVGANVSLPNDTTFSVGDLVVINADIIPVKVKIGESVNIYNYLEGVRWSLDSLKSIKISPAEPNYTEKVKVNARTAITKYIPAGEILYSMIFGDKKVMSSDFNSASKATGIAHLFAISGLHIGFVAGLVSFIAKKCRMNKYLDFIFVLILSGLYAMLVGFGPSVLRALLMLAVYKIGKLFGVRHCGVSSLSLSAMIILLINPLTLFNISFQLSVMAIAGILFFQRPLEKLIKTKFKFVNTFVSLNLSVNIALLPFMLHYFGRVSLIFLISNLLIVPFVSLTFPLIFIFVLLSSAYAPLGYVLYPIGIVFSLIELLVVWIAEIPFLSINFNLSIFLLVIYVVFLVVISSYSLFAKKAKIILAAIMGIIICINILLTSFGRIDGSVKVETVSANDNTDIVMLDIKNEHYLVVSGQLTVFALWSCASYMAENNIANIDGMVITNISQADLGVLSNFQERLNIKSLITNRTVPVVEYIFEEVIYYKSVGDYMLVPRDDNLIYLSGKNCNVVFVNGISDISDFVFDGKIDILYCADNFEIAVATKPKFYVNSRGIVNNICQSVRSDFTFIIKSAKINVRY